MSASQPLLQNDTLNSEALPVVLGVLSEQFSPDGSSIGGDQRVSLSPEAVSQFVKDGYVVNVEAGAGQYADMRDARYETSGASILSRDDVISKSGVLFSINPPVAEFPVLSGKTVISWVGRLTDDGKAIVEKAAEAGVMLIDVTAVPRITIAQQMDTLSSQAKCAGHRAVIEAAHHFGRFHGAEMTAAGKYAPAKTFVLGCGVAGLEAIGKSKALGSDVRAWDVRDVSDQVASMGAKWVKVEFKEDGAGAGGYAKESSAEFQAAQQATFLKVLKEVDIVMCTAAIPGRRSPLLITADAVAAMKAGSVIVDLAALGGGNCEMTRKGEVWTTPNDVTIIGYTDMPARMPEQSSAMFGQNMVNMLRYLHGKTGSTSLLTNINRHLDVGAPDGDIIARSIVCSRGGAKVEMPPPPQPTPPKPKTAVVEKKAKAPPNPCRVAAKNTLVLMVAIAIFLGLGRTKQYALLASFLLAGAAGYQAVWGVAHALHTPLMSVTNAISGMTAGGALLLLHKSTKGQVEGAPLELHQVLNTPWILSALALLISAINIFGGFVVSQRMLNLFRKPGFKDWSWFIVIPGVLLAALIIADSDWEETAGTISGVLCVAAIGGLASMQTADSGCKLGMIGVLGAVVSIWWSLPHNMLLAVSAGLLATGGLIGLIIGARVNPMALPQTVAAFHSLVGAAAMCTSVGSFFQTPVEGCSIENIAACLGTIVGAFTLTGSIIAFAKLNGSMSSKEWNFPFKNYLNLSMVFACVACTVTLIVIGTGIVGKISIVALAVVGCLIGFHVVGSVGGGDMPVCVTVLNSYSGWAIVAEGFLLNSPVLTVVGSVIGCSGAILTKIMCDAMNRDIFNVIFGGMNVAAPVKKSGEEAPKVHVETNVVSVVELLSNSKEVLIVPGYGMAVSRAQGSVGEIARICRENDVTVKFGIHPVAGRMPGQMNVLLAEAGVPHEWVLEMDEINPDMQKFDVCLVIGANDITNSAAQEVEGCSIWGMPVIEVWRAKKVIFCKRSMAGGYADLENPVFFKENTEMLLGDAKKTSEHICAKLLESFNESKV
mmetsp:Transcript_63476/g.168174  ORF Transcript_63476/g.168174 Transcript_63476/m.168174 type:complete len:1051 (-) Transcript_63476:117-3269(-)